ncbi:hypothetical protein B0T18DRAFT_62599 [Schizothecium vesticola]|uniref:Uncharacterized protein n=1 Tax=Schizothecium vesticola TaxID=314040 RepID=A0AA40K9K9_9PEZI|nr:hypothetical protein B0T18DRAFT_62599 [Schizothecium vesticola]
MPSHGVLQPTPFSVSSSSLSTHQTRRQVAYTDAQGAKSTDARLISISSTEHETAPEVTPPPPVNFTHSPPRCSRQQPLLCSNSGLQLLSVAYQTFRLHCPIVSRGYLYDTVHPPLSHQSLSSFSCLPSVLLPNTPTPSTSSINFTNGPSQPANIIILRCARGSSIQGFWGLVSRQIGIPRLGQYY